MAHGRNNCLCGKAEWNWTMGSAESGPCLAKSPDSCCDPVSQEESGQKLLRFLERRLALPQALLHRWVRTGQIRINGGRCKPFDRVKAGDLVRLPPFAGALSDQAAASQEDSEELPLQESSGNGGGDVVQRLEQAGLKLLGREGAALALFKPSGLPVQSGTGQPDSIASRLHEAWKDCHFQPAPAHRLDRDTSGVLLAAADFETLRNLQDSFRDGGIRKEYLVWVDGKWPLNQAVLLKDWLRKERTNGVSRMELREEGLPFAREALCIVRPVERREATSLLQVRLLTGRTHQIRAQLAGVGHPVYGDGKYGRGGADLKLHSLRIILPSGMEFSCPPPWDGNYWTGEVPEPLFAEHSNNVNWQEILPRFCQCVGRGAMDEK